MKWTTDRNLQTIFPTPSEPKQLIKISWMLITINILFFPLLFWYMLLKDIVAENQPVKVYILLGIFLIIIFVFCKRYWLQILTVACSDISSSEGKYTGVERFQLEILTHGMIFGWDIFLLKRISSLFFVFGTL